MIRALAHGLCVFLFALRSRRTGSVMHFPRYLFAAGAFLMVFRFGSFASTWKKMHDGKGDIIQSTAEVFIDRLIR